MNIFNFTLCKFTMAGMKYDYLEIGRLEDWSVSLKIHSHDIQNDATYAEHELHAAHYIDRF